MKRDLGAAVPRDEEPPVVGIVTLVVMWLSVGAVMLGAGTMLAIMLARAI